MVLKKDMVSALFQIKIGTTEKDRNLAVKTDLIQHKTLKTQSAREGKSSRASAQYFARLQNQNTDKEFRKQVYR